MKKLVLAVFFVLPAWASAYPRIFERGVYRGFGPTDQSAVMVGEVQIDVVTDHIIAIRFATGLKVDEDHFNLSQLVALPASEARELGLQSVAAYRPLDSEFPVIVLNRSLPGGIFRKVPAIFRMALYKLMGSPALTIYTGGMGDLIMPILLYNPKQVSGGRFDKAIKKMEKAFGKQGIVPRVGLNGRALSDVDCASLLSKHGTLNPEETP